MLDAGVVIGKALRTLETEYDKKNREKLKVAIQLVERGVSLPDSLLRAALIDDFDHAMLITADEVGRISEGLNHLSEIRIKQFQRADSLNASLLLPKGLVLVGAFAGVFVRTAAGNQPLLDALFSVVFITICFFLVCYLTLFLIRADTRIWMSWLWSYPPLLKRIQWCGLAMEYYFFNSLVWQISAGLPFSNAILRCNKLLSSALFQKAITKASNQTAAGGSLTNALIDNGLVISSRMRQVMLVADQSGKHELAIKHELKLQSIKLKLKAENFFKWMPRIFYVIALIFVSKIMAF